MPYRPIDTKSGSAFAERFLKHLDKIDQSEVEGFLLRLVEERDFFTRIFEALTEGIVVVDPEMRVSLVNTAARRILQWPVKRRLVGESLLDLLDEDGPLREIVLGFQEDPRPIRNQEMEVGGRSPRLYNLHLLPITDEGSQGAAAAIIIQDLTRARERQARTAQEEKMASLATLTAGVAHEIKNPLNSLSIHAQLLERVARDFSTGEAASSPARSINRIVQSCRVIGEEVERLRESVDHFIEAARPHKPVLAPNDLNRTVESVVRSAALESEALGIRIETFLEPDLPLVLVDERHVQSALRNLLRNAIEAVECAQRPPEESRITVRTHAMDETVVLEVSDTGVGVPDIDIPKIFEPYYTTKFNGSGLGLMAVARIVREHNGRLHVNSEDGEGSTFSLEFPVANRPVRLLQGGEATSGKAAPDRDATAPE